MSIPILTVITRHMPKSRSLLFKRTRESLKHFKSDIQHLIVEDYSELGWFHSAQLVVKNAPKAIGHYVWLLDDDDECTCCYLPDILNRIKNKVNPDLIIVKNHIAGRGLMPIPEHWNTKQGIQIFQMRQIAMPNFIMENKLFQAHVKFMPADRRVDWQIFSAIQATDRKSKLKVYWCDILAMIQRDKMEKRPQPAIDAVSQEVYFSYDN